MKILLFEVTKRRAFETKAITVMMLTDFQSFRFLTTTRQITYENISKSCVKLILHLFLIS